MDRLIVPSILAEGNDGLSFEEIEKGPFVCLAGLDALWNTVYDNEKVTTEELNKILESGRACFQTAFDKSSGDEENTYQKVIKDHGKFEEVSLSLEPHQRFQKPSYPTLRDLSSATGAAADAVPIEPHQRFQKPSYPTLRGLSSAADAAVEEAPKGNSYRKRIEELLTALYITATRNEMGLLAALLFKGTEENPKAYGVFVSEKSRKKISSYEFYLLDPYGVNGKISFHKFASTDGFLAHFMKIAPGSNQNESNYWVMPLKPCENRDSDDEKTF